MRAYIYVRVYEYMYMYSCVLTCVNVCVFVHACSTVTGALPYMHYGP